MVEQLACPPLIHLLLISRYKQDYYSTDAEHMLEGIVINGIVVRTLDEESFRLDTYMRVETFSEWRANIPRNHNEWMETV